MAKEAKTILQMLLRVHTPRRLFHSLLRLINYFLFVSVFIMTAKFESQPRLKMLYSIMKLISTLEILT